jgi:hypothetical protein
MAVVMDLLRDESEEGDVDAEPEDEEAEVEPLSAGREDVLPRGVLVLLGLVGSGWGSALPTEREGGGALTDGRSLGHGAELARGGGQLLVAESEEGMSNGRMTAVLRKTTPSVLISLTIYSAQLARCRRPRRSLLFFFPLNPAKDPLGHDRMTYLETICQQRVKRQNRPLRLRSSRARGAVCPALQPYRSDCTSQPSGWGSGSEVDGLASYVRTRPRAERHPRGGGGVRDSASRFWLTSGVDGTSVRALCVHVSVQK